MTPKSGSPGKFFPLMKWENDFLLGLKDVSGKFAMRPHELHFKPAAQIRKSALSARKSRNRLARFLPRHGKLMVR